MKSYKNIALAILSCAIFSGCTAEDTSSYGVSNASFAEIDNEIGCDSKYSEDKKNDIFNAKYKNHWMTWSGEVVLAEADQVSLNVNGFGTQDLRVYFEDERAGYNVLKGDTINVRFVMDRAGGCFLPFSGRHASILPAAPINENKNTVENTDKLEIRTEIEPLLEQQDRQFDLNELGDQHPTVIFDNQSIKEQFQFILGNNYEGLVKNLDVASGIKVDGDFYFGSGCATHSCGTEEAAFAVNSVNGHIFAAILEDKKIKIFGVNDLESLPSPLYNWYKSHLSNTY